MARRTGRADLPLHGGRVPPWLAQRMATVGAIVCQAIVHHYGREELLRRLSHPFWFQSFGAVMGMDPRGVATDRRRVQGAMSGRQGRSGRWAMQVHRGPAGCPGARGRRERPGLSAMRRQPGLSDRIATLDLAPFGATWTRS
jgi:hypothetical protein